MSLLCLVLLAGCSLAGLGYRYADWLIKRRILEVVKLYSPQQDKLEQVLDDYMLWHKSKMLPRYQQTLEKTLQRLESLKEKPVTEMEMYQFLLEIRGLYQESFQPLAKAVTPILVELGAEQVERSKVLINRKLEEIKNKSEEPISEQRDELISMWKDNMEEYLGKVEPDQVELLNTHIPLMMVSGKVRFARGVSRMKVFINIFEDFPLLEGPDLQKNRLMRGQKLEVYFKSWGEEKIYDPWRKEAATFLTKTLKSLDDEQMNSLKKTFKSWRDSVKEMQKP